MNRFKDRLRPFRCAARAAAVAALLGAAGCASSRTPGPPDAAAVVPATAAQESDALARTLTEKILTHPFPGADETLPLLVMQAIVSRPAHAELAASVTDRLRAKLASSGKVRFVDPTLCARWLAGEGLHVSAGDEDIGIKMARRLGAKYVLSGRVTSLPAAGAALLRSL